MPYPTTQETAALPLCSDSPIPSRISPAHTVDKRPADTGFLDATACTHFVQTPSARAPETKAIKHDHIQILIDLVECVNRISMRKSGRQSLGLHGEGTELRGFFDLDTTKLQ